jgi:hypothetical protein
MVPAVIWVASARQAMANFYASGSLKNLWVTRRRLLGRLSFGSNDTNQTGSLVMGRALRLQAKYQISALGKPQAGILSVNGAWW